MKFFVSSSTILLLSFFTTTTTAFVVTNTAPSLLSDHCYTSRNSDRIRLFSTEEAAQEENSNDEQEKISIEDTSPFENGSKQELMYALGVNLARQLGDIRPFVENGEELAAVAKGLLDTVVGKLSDDGQKKLLLVRGKDLTNLITERAQNIKERLEADGRQMLQGMADTEGAERLESGVVVHVIESNEDGQSPTRASTVKVHYSGTLTDGTVFDSTLNDDPVSFPVAKVIPGWGDGILKMREGEVAMVGIPPDQGYGDEGTPDGRIPGGSTLFFKIQLIEVMSAGVGGGSVLLGVDGKALKKNDSSSGLLGADGNPI